MAKKDKKAEEFIDFSTENIVTGTFSEALSERFAAYSKYVIQDRALPDVRDGLKPVQRRILFGMKESGMISTSPHKKSARIVGDVMGKYHPHGDSSIYDAMVRMSQWWKSNAILIDMHGNNGSLDDDPAAAYRYTEARLAPIAMEVLKDLDKDTVEMAPNFDDLLKEPTVLPARFPLLLVNGAKGIAAGFATEIPPHNLGEVIDATICRIKSPNCRLDTIMEIIKGPDFPTGGQIFGKEGIIDAFKTGKGKVIIRSKCEVVEDKSQRQIIITEIPYDVIKINLVKRIDEIRFNKEIWGMDEVRDESDRNGLRIVIDISKDADAQLILNYLYKSSDLQVSYNYNMVVIVDRTPKLVGIISALDAYIAHQKEVILRRSKYDFEHYSNRLHIVDGLIKMVSIIDQVVSTIRSSSNKAEAKEKLIKMFGFSIEQAEAILMLQLYRLSSTDVTQLMAEKAELEAKNKELKDIVDNDNSLKNVLISELREIKNKYATPRKSEVFDEIEEIVINKAATVIKEDVMVAITRDGYAKYSQLKSYSTSNVPFPGYKDGDAIVYVGQGTTLDTLLVFTSGGNFMYLPVFELSENKWKDEGVHINKIASYSGQEKIVGAFLVSEFRSDMFVTLVTSKASIKRSQLSGFVLQRYSKAASCYKLADDEVMVSAFVTNGGCDVAVLYELGYVVRYAETQISVVGVKAGGVRSGSRSFTCPVVGAVPLSEYEKRSVCVTTDKGGLKTLSLRQISASVKRDSIGNLVFKSLSNDVHKATGIGLCDDNDPIFAVSNFKTYPVFAKDVPLQGKIIKPTLKLNPREKIVACTMCYNDNISLKTKAKKVNNVQGFFNDIDKMSEEEKTEEYNSLSIDDLFKN